MSPGHGRILPSGARCRRSWSRAAPHVAFARTSLSAAWLTAASLACASTAIAQSTSPRGFQRTEGNTRFLMFGVDRRLQVVDRTQVGHPAQLTAIAFRRDGSTTSSGWTARAVDCTLQLGRGDLGVVAGDYAQNYRGAATVAFARRRVVVPDWTAPTPSPPAAFDFVLALDAPFVHAGDAALVWDLTAQSSATATGTAMDREFTAYATQAGAALGSGCLASGQSAPFLHLAALQDAGASLLPLGMWLQFSGIRAPANAAVVVHIDVADANLPIAGVCDRVRALPTISVLLGASDASGAVAERAWGFGFAPALVGGVLVTQLVALDAGQAGLPVALSNGRHTTMPAAVAGAIAAGYVFGDPAQAGAVFLGGAPIAELR